VKEEIVFDISGTATNKQRKNTNPPASLSKVCFIRMFFFLVPKCCCCWLRLYYSLLLSFKRETICFIIYSGSGYFRV